MRIFLLILFFITSCSVPNWWKPRGYLLFSMMPKGGTPGHDLGWIHGCQSGAGSQFGGEVYMTFYTWSRDPDLTVSNPDIAKIRKKYGDKELKNVNWNDPNEVKKNIDDYNTIFWSAHFVCRQTVLGSIQTGGIHPPLPGDTRYDPAAHHLGTIYKLNGKGDARIGSTGHW